MITAITLFQILRQTFTWTDKYTTSQVGELPDSELV